MAFIQLFTIPKENLTTFGDSWTSNYHLYSYKITYCKSPVIFGNVGESTRTLTSQGKDIPTSDKYYFALAVAPFTIEYYVDNNASSYAVSTLRTNYIVNYLGMTISGAGKSSAKLPDLQDIMLEMIKAFPYKLTKVQYPIGTPSVNGVRPNWTSVYNEGFYSTQTQRDPVAFMPSLSTNSDGGWNLTCSASSTTDYKLTMPPLYELAFAFAVMMSASGESFESKNGPFCMVMPVLINSSGRVITDNDL